MNSHPYLTDPTNYDARHRDLSQEAIDRCKEADAHNFRAWACNHHHPRHSAFVAAERAS